MNVFPWQWNTVQYNNLTLNCFSSVILHQSLKQKWSVSRNDQYLWLNQIFYQFLEIDTAFCWFNTVLGKHAMLCLGMNWGNKLLQQLLEVKIDYYKHFCRVKDLTFKVDGVLVHWRFSCNINYYCMKTIYSNNMLSVCWRLIWCSLLLCLSLCTRYLAMGWVWQVTTQQEASGSSPAQQCLLPQWWQLLVRQHNRIDLVGCMFANMTFFVLSTRY